MRNAVVVGNSLQVLSPVLQAIRSFSRAQISVIGNDGTRSIRWSRLCDRWTRHSLCAEEDASLLASLQESCARDSSSRIIAVDCEAAHALNRLRDHLPAPVAPMPDAQQLALLEDKWLFHRFCQQHDLPTPLTLCFNNKQALHYEALASALGVPFVIKPSNLAGSMGVCIISSEAIFELEILRRADYQFSPLLAQEYIPGEDIDISLLAVGGEVMTLAVQQVSGSVVRFVSQPEMEVMATQLCAASRYEGVMHIDARIDRDTGRICLIESNPRFWASMTAALWCGLNFVQESLKYVRDPQNNKGPMRLTRGRAYTRYPLLRHGSLRCLLDRGLQGHLLRLSVMDPWRISRLMQELSAQLMRQARASLPRRRLSEPSWKDKLLRNMVSKCN